MVDYVDLNRNFIPVGKDSEPDLTMGRAWGHRYGGWLHWSNLLDHPRVVLLAEASSGKTEEFKHAALGLNLKGALGFYSTIEQLSAGRLGLGQAEQEAFENWKAGSDPAWFFLDSVDEARLNQKKFDDALRNFAIQIAGALQRANILISCRASDWKGNSDRTTILEILPSPQPPPPPILPENPDAALLDPIFEKPDGEAKSPHEKKIENPELLVVQLIPLSDDQRRILAQAAGIRDVDTFMNAIALQGLDVLAERPGDVLELAQYWALKGKFGSLSEMTEHTVTAKLKEFDKYRPDNSALPLGKARKGAERLAAALTWGKTFILFAPGQEPDPALASGALDPSALLDDWTVAEVNALMRRGIFAPSTYGRVRFHHRSTQEYLAGKWLSRLMDEGCPRSAVFDLLFADRYGVETVVPSLRSASAWLALDQTDVRDEIIKREPLLLLTHGDPAALPSDVKRRLLIHLATRHVAGDISDDSIDRRSMWMFASSDLAEAIHDAWRINSRAEFRADLVRLVREGTIEGCIDLAFEMAKDKKQRDYHRIVALQALVACGADAEISTIAKALLKKPSDATSSLASGFSEALFPKYMSVSELFSVIEKSQPARVHAVAGFPYVLDNLWQACPNGQQAAFLGGLADLVLRPPFVQDYHRVSKQFADLAKQSGHIAQSLTAALGTQGEPSSDLVKLLGAVERAERSSRLPDDLPPLSELVRQNAKLQRALFWFDVHETRKHSSRPVVSTWDIYFGGEVLWSIAAPDLPWLRNDLASSENEHDRRVALSIIAQLRFDQLKSDAPSLRKLIGKNTALRRDLAGYVAPRKPNAIRKRHERQSAVGKRQRSAQEAKGKKSWQTFRDKLAKAPEQLSVRSHVASNAGFTDLRNLSEWLRRKTGKEYEQAAVEWKLLEPAFSQEIAAHYRDGMKLLWRITPPERPMRYPGGPITTKWATILSYAAVSMEAAHDNKFPGNLSEDDIKQAALHACLSEQGYPDWLDQFIVAHPAIVVPIVRAAFFSEWTAPDTAGSFFIYRFAQYATPIDPAVQRELLEVISTTDPLTLRALENSIGIIRKCDLTPDQRARLIDFAQKKFKLNSSAKTDWALRYIALLFLLDVPEAVKTLLPWLKSKASRKHGNFVLQALGTLFGTHHPLVSMSLGQASIKSIEQLIVFAYQAVRPEHDVVHEGMYQPDVRDDAESARGAFLKTLTERSGRDAYETLLRLSRHRDLRARKIRFRELARRMAERDAEQEAWTTAEVLAFERNRVSPVKSGVDLYRLTQAVMAEITWDFDNADASSRAVLETAKDENAVQEYLAEQFRLRANSRYHTARETEVAEGNMPDIIISSVSAPVSVAIEGKHGGKGWSTASLEDALRKQLAEDYLRPSDRRHGILVISNHNARRWKHPVSLKNVSFSDMIAYLQGVASTILRNSVGNISVAVVGIDALPRTRKRSAAKSSRKEVVAKRKRSSRKRRR